MNWKSISRNVGSALLVSALFMLMSIFVSVINGHDSAFSALMISFVITFAVGAFPFIFVRNVTELTLKEGYLTIALSWLLSFIFGMLPYALWGEPFTVENAWFESVSGFTTTGATILNDVEVLPRSLLFWRSSTHFIGGLGVVVFLLLIIPDTSPVKMRLVNMELSSLSRTSYSTKANKTVYIFAYVYLAIAGMAMIAYLFAGMNLFDAVCHAFSVCATGGFSTRNLSIGAFNSRPVELITMIFMVLSTIHFGLLYFSVVTRSFKPLNNPVLKFYLLSLLVFSLITSFVLRIQGVESTLGKAMWVSAFQTISTASTSGFAITDNANWPMLPNFLMMMMAFMCGCAGSTTGGVKADRVLVLLKSIGVQVGRILHPSSVHEIRMGTRAVKDEDVSPHILYISIYCFCLSLSVLIALACGCGAGNSFAASLSSLSNIGPALAELGNMGSYDSVPSAAKFLFTMDMFLGRVEIYPLLAVVAMIFDGRKR